MLASHNVDSKLQDKVVCKWLSRNWVSRLDESTRPLHSDTTWVSELHELPKPPRTWGIAAAESSPYPRNGFCSEHRRWVLKLSGRSYILCHMVWQIWLFWCPWRLPIVLR
jgi:hypothetical protein